VAPKEDEYQKSVGLKFRHCLGVYRDSVILECIEMC